MDNNEKVDFVDNKNYDLYIDRALSREGITKQCYNRVSVSRKFYSVVLENSNATFRS